MQSMIKINSSLIVAKSSIFTWHQARLLIENISFSITLAELIIKEPEYSSKYLETKIKNKKQKMKHIYDKTLDADCTGIKKAQV